MGVYVCVFVCVYTCICICVYKDECVCMQYVFRSVGVYVCVCVCVMLSIFLNSLGQMLAEHPVCKCRMDLSDRYLLIRLR